MFSWKSTTAATRLAVSAADAGLVLAGGAVGTGARYQLGLLIPEAGFIVPLVTLAINVAGAFLLGALLEGLVLRGDDVGWRRHARLAVGTGFCGGFTTYSSLAVAVTNMAQQGHPVRSLAYGGGSIVLGALAAFAGIVVAVRMHREVETTC